ncbi:MAG TPA: hypothetical protein PLH57_09520 [Oligoflexia bacterium]|nr:hypothetical protein [Oligoflexia bacterium]
MSDDNKNTPPPPAPPGGENPILAADRQEEERKGLIEAIVKLEQEITVLEARIRNNSKERADEARQQNDQLKAEFTQLEQELFDRITKQKFPLDAGSISVKLESVKKAAIDYCTERKLDQELWKNLESL